MKIPLHGGIAVEMLQIRECAAALSGGSVAHLSPGFIKLDAIIQCKVPELVEMDGPRQ